MFSTTFSKRMALIILVVGSSLLTGCASIVSGRYQEISIQTRNNDQPVAGVGCELVNNKGRYFVTTPATITVHKSYQDLQVKCQRADLEPGSVSVKSSTKGIAYGNILFGGLIGVGIDAGTGAAYDYPTSIAVDMGRTLFIPPRVATAAEIAATAAPLQVPMDDAASARNMKSATKGKQASPYAADASIRPVVAQKEIVIGISSATVERLAKDIGCETAVGADLISAPGPAEEYEVKCKIGGFVRAKCELRQCQLN